MNIAKAIGWFLATIVFPLTAWFVVLKVDVAANAKETESIKAEVMGIANEIKIDRTHLGHKLEEIQRSIGRIEGKLDRRK